VTYQSLEPMTPAERWQERCEEMYAREERMPLRDSARAYFDLAGSPVPQAIKGSGEATQEEADPVEAADRWLWATAAWWKLDPAETRRIAATQGLDAALKYAEPVTREVNEKAFQKRFEHWVAKGCPQPKGNQ
jgi:hypothetical protein